MVALPHTDKEPCQCMVCRASRQQSMTVIYPAKTPGGNNAIVHAHFNKEAVFVLAQLTEMAAKKAETMVPPDPNLQRITRQMAAVFKFQMPPGAMEVANDQAG
jgi:hypothetical protein